ncbi:MAG: type VI secretion system baseplate subunit TssE [Alphaproteobacteria bacterium]|nr:type VI secretion system baseplate subunit TssE [Alphaproteobacteria bacterium]
MKKSSYIHEPQKCPGAFIPLFERLVDFDIDATHESPVQKFHDFDSMTKSIERELFHILGSFVKFEKKDYIALSKNDDNFGLPGMFGVPEFSMFEGTNTYNWKPLTRYLEKIIERFEPRLSNITVVIQGVDKSKQFLNITITATLCSPHFQEEVTFSMALKPTV